MRPAFFFLKILPSNFTWYYEFYKRYLITGYDALARPLTRHFSAAVPFARLYQFSLPITPHQACPQGQALARLGGLPGGPTPGAGTRRQGRTGGRTRSVEKTRVKSGFVFPIPAILRWRTQSRQPAALRTRHQAALCRGVAAVGRRLSKCLRFLRGHCPHASVPRIRGHSAPIPRRLYEYPAR